MSLRIVNENGLGHTTRVFDTETGEDLTSRLCVADIDLHVGVNEVISAHIRSYVSKIEVMVPEARVYQVCPYCGHPAGEFVLVSARDLEAAPENTGESESEEHADGESES